MDVLADLLALFCIVSFGTDECLCEIIQGLLDVRPRGLDISFKQLGDTHTHTHTHTQGYHTVVTTVLVETTLENFQST